MWQGNAVEWRGRWCDGSREWELLGRGERARVGLYFDSDGEWWMSFADFLHHFDQVELCHVPLNAAHIAAPPRQSAICTNFGTSPIHDCCAICSVVIPGHQIPKPLAA